MPPPLVYFYMQPPKPLYLVRTLYGASADRPGAATVCSQHHALVEGVSVQTELETRAIKAAADNEKAALRAELDALKAKPP